MQGRATVAGHPLHPPLTAIPIGSFVAAAIADILSIWIGPHFLAAVSTWLIGVGVASGLLAAFVGTIEYLSAPMSAPAKRIASWHMSLQVTSIVVFGIALAVRIADHTSPAGYFLTGMGVVVLVVGGWLGGELVYKYRVGTTEAYDKSPLEAPEELGGTAPARQ